MALLAAAHGGLIQATDRDQAKPAVLRLANLAMVELYSFRADLLNTVAEHVRQARWRAHIGPLVGVEARIGMTTVHVFGFESPEALPLAEKCGVAFQLTNILRDIAEDADVGRVYLPEDDLARFDLTPRDLIERRHDERFRALMEFEWQRANRYYDDAAPLLGLIRPGSRAAMWTLITIYRRILRRIRAIGFNVYDQRPSLSDLEKSWILLRALKLRLLGGAPPFPA